ncbi:MAG: transposase [Nitrospirota bacterium]
MARQLRIEYEGAFYHITSRGNQREDIYWDDKDREEFKKILKRTKEIYGYFLYAYVLMDNHYHLLIETPHANIKQIMQNINTSYTVYVNRRHKRFGHLFQGRYKAFIVDKGSYLLELGRYIHLNPVRAGVVRMPEEYRWSSYREYFQRDRQQVITNTDDTLYLFSRKRAIAIKKYQEFVNANISEGSPLKNAVGSILGDETFKDRVIKYLKGIPDKTEIPEIKKIEAKHNIEDIVKAVAKYYGVKEEDLLKRKKATERQRKIAMYLCKTLSGRKNIEVGEKFRVTLQAVTNAIRDIERKRDKDKKLNKEIILLIKSVEK